MEEPKNNKEVIKEEEFSKQENEEVKNKMNKFLLSFLIIIIITLASLIGYMMYHENTHKDIQIEQKEEKIIEEKTIQKEVLSINDVDLLYNKTNNISFDVENYDFYYIKDNKLYIDSDEPIFPSVTSKINIKKLITSLVNETGDLYALTIDNELYRFSLTNGLDLFKISKVTEDKVDDIGTIDIKEENELKHELIYKIDNKIYIIQNRNEIKELSQYLKEQDYLELYPSNSKMTFGYTINNEKKLVEYYESNNKKVYTDKNGNNIYPKYIINDEIDNIVYIIDSDKVYESKDKFNMNELGIYNNLIYNNDSLELEIDNNKYIFIKK